MNFCKRLKNFRFQTFHIYYRIISRYAEVFRTQTRFKSFSLEKSYNFLFEINIIFDKKKVQASCFCISLLLNCESIQIFLFFFPYFEVSTSFV